ncbi:myosin-11-like [Clytia hemisphaerica]
MENLRQQNEDWRLQEENKMKEEMENYKNLMMGELRQTQKEKELLQQSIFELQQTNGKKKSNLGDLMDDDEKTSYKDLFDKMKGLESELLEQINTLREQHKKEEAAHKIVFTKKLAQEKDKQDKLAKQRDKDKMFYEDQIIALKQRLTEHDAQIEENTKKATLAVDRADSRSEKENILSRSTKDEVDSRPIPPKRSLPYPSQEVEIVEKELPEKDGVTLWVSMNQSLTQPSFRVFKTPSSAQGDWKDLFSFNALMEPVGDFTKALYVYSCPGSPYWRQYVSGSATLPKSNYKHDFTFYTTTEKLLGTVKITVYEAGSGSVVRSMIHKGDTVPGPEWRQKTSALYVLKTGPAKTSVTRSGTFNSDIFDGVSDDDDVSVSTITGTDIVKNLIADDIKRSRENLLEDKDDVNIGDDTKGEFKEEELYSDEEEESDLHDDEVDARVHEQEKEKENELKRTQESNFGTSSSSFLNATLPEKGEFYPYKHNPLAVARYNHSKEMLSGQRKEMLDILDDHLEKRGLDPDERRMAHQVYKKKLAHLVKEQEMKNKTFPGFTHYRQKLKDAVDDFTFQEWAKKKGKKAGKRFKQAAGAIKGLVQAVKKSPIREEIKQDRHSSTFDDDESFEGSDSDETSPPPADKKQRKIYTKDLEEVSSTENERVMLRYQRAMDSDEESIVQRNDEETNEQPHEEEEDLSGTWDTDEDDDLDETDEHQRHQNQPQSPPQYYHQQEEEEYRPKMRSPQGEKVKELTKNLEASLTLRGSIKKPAGAVDLHHTQEKDENELKPKRSVSFRDQNQYHGGGNMEDEDDESDFSLSSNDNTRENQDNSQNKGSYRPSTSKPPAPSSSSTPYGASTAGPSRQQQQQSTAVTKFTLEDFDDDDESF